MIKFAERHPLPLGLVVLALVGVITWLSIIAINGVPLVKTHTVKAVISEDAPLLKDGDDVRIGGQRAGQVREVKPGRGGALVTMELNDGPVGRGATARVRLRGLAGSTYVAIERGDTSRPLENATIPRTRTSSGVDLSDVVGGFDADTRRSLGRSTAAYGIGVIDRGEHVNRALADLPPALTDLTPILDKFSPAPGQLSDLVAQARIVSGAVAPPGSRELGGLVDSAASTFLTLARSSPDLAESIDRTRPFEDEALATLPKADPLLDETRELAAQFTPTVQALDRALPPLNNALTRRQEVAALGTIAHRGRPLVQQATPLVQDAKPAAGALRPLADPLLPLTAYANDYPEDLFGGPDGFTRWGGFRYADGQASGARAVRFAPVFTCAKDRNPYPKPNVTVNQESKPCLG